MTYRAKSVGGSIGRSGLAVRTIPLSQLPTTGQTKELRRLTGDPEAMFLLEPVFLEGHLQTQVAVFLPSRALTGRTAVGQLRAKNPKALLRAIEVALALREEPSC